MSNKTSPTKIVVIGAGTAGINAGIELVKFGESRDDIEVRIIDDSGTHFLPHLSRDYLVGRVGDEADLSLDHIFKGTEAALVEARVTGVDVERRVVETSEREYPYDYLVMAPGSVVDFGSIEGAEAHAFSPDTFMGAGKLREHVIMLFEKASRESDEEVRKGMLTFVVAGGKADGFQLSLALSEWLEELRLANWVPTEEIEVILVDDESLSGEPDSVVQLAERRLRERGIRHLRESISRVSPFGAALGNGLVVPTETVIITGRSVAHPVMEGLELRRDDRGGILTDRDLRTAYPGVYTAGSCAAIVSGDGNEVQRSSRSEGVVAARNIRADITGGSTSRLSVRMPIDIYYLGEGNPMAIAGGKVLPRPLALAAEKLQTIWALFRLGGRELVERFHAGGEGADRPESDAA